MKAVTLILFLFVQLFAVAFAETAPKKYTTLKTTLSPKIDGKLDDEAWKNIAAITSFVDALPIEGAEPSQQTEIKIIYDDQAIYIGGMMYDTAPDSVLHEFGNRDNDDLNADKVRIVFDTYNTRVDAYDFGLYASGVQTDYKFSDETFDAVWQSATQLNDKGWSFEMKIPYSAIRFPNSNEQLWALQVTRSIRRNREFIQWNLTPKSEDNPFKFWGTLEGLKDIKPPLRLSLTPYLSAYYEHSPVYNNTAEFEYANTMSYRAGADIKYGIDEKFTLDMTLLPDFGQVKSDDKVKNLSYNEIVYEENRPFFQEGTELFNHFGLFYSRRIGATPSLFYSVPYMLDSGEKITDNPSQAKMINATKISGRTSGGTGIGFLNAITDNTYATVEDENGTKRKILTEPFTNFNVISLDQQLKNNSTIYFINLNTVRANNGNDANVTGAGYSIANKKNTIRADGNFALSQQFINSESEKKKYDPETGYKYFVGVQKTGGAYQYGISTTQVSSKFNGSDLGYQSLPNFNNNRIFGSWQLLKPYKILQEANVFMAYNLGIDKQTQQITRHEISLDAFALSRDYNALFGGVSFTPTSWRDYYEPRVQGRYYQALRYYFIYLGISTDYRKKFAVDMTNVLPNFVDEYTWFGWNNETTLRYRFSNKFTLTYKFTYNYDPFNIGVVDNSDEQHIVFGGRVLNTYVNQVSARYIFKNDLSLNLNARHYWIIGEYKKYFLLEEDGDLADYDSYNQNNNFNFNVMNIDAVFSWQFAPGSNISIAYKFALEHQDYPAITLPTFKENFSQVLTEPQINSFSVRALYYLDWNYLVKNKQRNR